MAEGAAGQEGRAPATTVEVAAAERPRSQRYPAVATPQILPFEVTSKDIVGARKPWTQPEYAGCPIRRALLRTYGHPMGLFGSRPGFVAVGSKSALVGNQVYPLSERARRFVRMYDTGYYVFPFKDELRLRGGS